MQETHALPSWFIRFQDTAGLSLLVIALMGINGIVYASGVVPSVDNPSGWGIFGTVLFVLFFAAGAAMPGIALRAGAGIFAGPPLRRIACALIALMFFVLEVWASVTERSLMTFTTPADRWLLSIIHMPNLPFSPTVFALSLAISIAVIAWGIVVTPPARESEEDAAHKERLKTLRAQAKAERARIYAAAIGGATRATIQAAKGDDNVDISSTTNTGIDAGLEAAMLDIASTTNSGDTPPIDAQDDGGKAGGTKRRKAGVSSVPSDMMSAPQFRQYLAQNGVRISPEKSVAYVQSIQGYDKVGTMFCARKGPLMKLANRLIDRAHTTGNADDEAQAKGA